MMYSLKKLISSLLPTTGGTVAKCPSPWLDTLNPKIIVIGEAPSQHLNYYQGFDTIKQNSAGDLVFDCVTNAVHIYVENDSYQEDFLDDENKSDKDDLYYLGTLNL